MGSYSKLIYHVIFATRYRRKTINDDVRARLYKYIGGVIRKKNGRLIEIGGVEDHLHVLASFAPVSSLSESIRDIKANSAKWMNSILVHSNKFEWQKGYGAFTVSSSQIESVCQYIRNQKEHHRRISFTEEYIAFLKRHEISFEHQYLFDGENS